MNQKKAQDVTNGPAFDLAQGAHLSEQEPIAQVEHGVISFERPEDDSDTPRVIMIIQLEAAAEKLDQSIKDSRKLADVIRGEAAREIVAELATGKTQQQLADEIGKSQPHVSYMASAWEALHQDHNQGYNCHSFNRYYQLAKKPMRPVDPESEDGPEDDEPEADSPKPLQGDSFRPDSQGEGYQDAPGNNGIKPLITAPPSAEDIGRTVSSMDSHVTDPKLTDKQRKYLISLCEDWLRRLRDR